MILYVDSRGVYCCLARGRHIHDEDVGRLGRSRTVATSLLCVIVGARVSRVFCTCVCMELQPEFLKFASFKTRRVSSPPLDCLEASVRFMLLWVSVGWKMWSAAQCFWWRWGWRFLVRMSLACVFGALNSPNLHGVLNVFLSDCVMSCVDCSGVLIHCGLGCDVFGGLVISV